MAPGSWTGNRRGADTLSRHGGEPPFRVDGREFSIGASIGVSLFPADAAMYRAKQLGRNNYRFYGR